VPIKGFSDRSLDGNVGLLSDGQYEAVETINHSAPRPEKLINQLIRVALSVKSKMVINPTIIHEFKPAGGRVTLAAEARPASLRLSVRGTGLGISPDQLGLIFERFAQVSDGSGLALALARRIDQSHDAHAQVNNRPGQGSTLAFELPLAWPAPAASEPACAPPAA
jgi:signal transduction histidine kinase